MDTVIPELPTKEKMLKKPNWEDFEKEMRDLDQKAQELRASIDECHHKRSQVYQGGKREGEDVTFKDLIAKNIDEVKAGGILFMQCNARSNSGWERAMPTAVRSIKGTLSHAETDASGNAAIQHINPIRTKPIGSSSGEVLFSRR